MRNENGTYKLRQEGRIWEIDALRGLLILCVLCYHLFMTVQAFMIEGRFNVDPAAYVRISDPLNFWFVPSGDTFVPGAFPRFVIDYLQPHAVATFFIISGICCTFSKDNLKRGLKTLAAGFFVSAFTKLLAIWTGDPTRFIRFGILLCYAFCQLIYVFLFENKRSRILLLASIPVFVLGYYFKYHGMPPTRLPLLYIFGVPQLGDQSSDWWPVFPMLGWFLLGVTLGRRFYAEKKTCVPCSRASRLTAPLQWLGRRSGIIYVSHIVIYTAVFCGIGYLFGLL